MRPSATDLFGADPATDIVTGAPNGWHWLNPSVAYGPDRTLIGCNIRMSNYVEREGNYTPSHPDGVIRTRNWHATLDPDTLAVAHILSEISWGVSTPVLYRFVQGLEDVRLFWKNNWCVLATSRQHHPSGRPQMVLVNGGDYDYDCEYLPMQTDCEKNWVPIIGTDTLRYQAYPPAVYSDGKVVRWPNIKEFPDLPELRGSSQVIPLGKGGIAVTHEVTWEPHRCYWHRFVRYGPAGDLLAVTEPFYFVAPGIEFAAGLIEWRNYYVVSFGHRDERAMLIKIPKPKVLEALDV